MSPDFSLIIRENAPGIAILVGGWICVSGIQNGEGIWSLFGFLLVVGALFIWMWDQDEERKRKGPWG